MKATDVKTKALRIVADRIKEKEILLERQDVSEILRNAWRIKLIAYQEIEMELKRL